METTTTTPAAPSPPVISREDSLLTDKQVAPLLGMQVQTLRSWRSIAARGGRLHGPKFIRIGGRSIRYRLADVLAYRDRCEAQTADDLGLCS